MLILSDPLLYLLLLPPNVIRVSRLTYTGLCGGLPLEHLQIETRIIGGRFESVKSECLI
jgi:hypothetical protein